METIVEIARPEAVWKNVAMFLSGVVLTLMMTWGTYVRTAVSREEMEKYVSERQGNVSQQLSDLNQNVIALKAEVTKLQTLQEYSDQSTPAVPKRRIKQ